jgi:gliding motility-associated-like protein
LQELKVEVPNVFSPNGDGINEMFSLIISNAKSIEAIIIDRWGNKILQTTDFKFVWDGTHKGQLVSAGAYPYVLDVFYFDGKQENKSGNITVIR